MRWATRALVLLALGVAAVVSTGCSGSAPTKSATLGIHFSYFEQQQVTVRAGAPVTFKLENHDPIEHEWIVGTREVHERHRLGTEPVHDQIPTEVTVPALSTRLTTVTFEQPGEYEFICHLPGHEAYGMKGVVRVVG